MVSKKDYLEVIRLIKKQYQLLDNFSNALGMVIDGWAPILNIDENPNKIYKILINSIDKNLWDWTEWWLYEAGGIDHTYTIPGFEKVEDNKKEYVIKTAEDIWNMVMND